MAVDLSDLEEPVAVWKAVEGDRAELKALLRSDKKLGRWSRDALADWLEGKLEPVKLPKGRPRGRAWSPFALRPYYGHNPTTKLGTAGFLHEHFRRFIRKKGWHLKKSGRFYRSSEWLMVKIAERQEIDLEKFTNYMNRPRPKRHVSACRADEYVERRRHEIALEIRHAKMRSKG